MLLFIFIFGHVTRKGDVIFRVSCLHRAFVHTLRPENRILELLLIVCQDMIKLSKRYSVEWLALIVLCMAVRQAEHINSQSLKSLL